MLERLPTSRRVLRTARIAVEAPLELLDPSPWILRRRARVTPVPPLVVLTVYRRRFARQVAALRRTLDGGARLLAWALDGAAPALAAVTAGSGPGERFTLLNRLLALADPPADAWVVLADDDVEFARGTPAELVRAATHCGLDLCQPAHSWPSEVSYRYSRRRPLVLARRTGWVEQGPVLAFGPRARERLLPLPGWIRWPGWGVEALWVKEERAGLALGIVDGITIVHLQRAASGYSRADADAQALEVMRRVGVADLASARRDRARWRPWGLGL